MGLIAETALARDILVLGGMKMELVRLYGSSISDGDYFYSQLSAPTECICMAFGSTLGSRATANPDTTEKKKIIVHNPTTVKCQAILVMER
jgi:hypothetical protein